jgi:hypothetical protein
MSNRVGDRYTCMDPNCGCEMEVTRACESSSVAAGDERGRTSRGSTTTVEPIGHGVFAGGSLSNRGFRSEAISTSSDFGKQGTTGEGVFGTVAAESDHVHTEGRYGSKLLKHSAGSTAAPAGSSGHSSTPMCFCGSRMREVGAD